MEEIFIQRTNRPDLKFVGEKLAAVARDENVGGSAELTLYRTQSGQYVLEECKGNERDAYVFVVNQQGTWLQNDFLTLEYTPATKLLLAKAGFKTTEQADPPATPKAARIFPPRTTSSHLVQSFPDSAYDVELTLPRGTRTPIRLMCRKLSSCTAVDSSAEMSLYHTRDLSDGAYLLAVEDLNGWSIAIYCPASDIMAARSTFDLMTRDLVKAAGIEEPGMEPVPLASTKGDDA